MENNIKFNNIDKDVLDENIGDEALKAVDDEKLMKRLMVSSLAECISTLNEIDKSINVINAIIGTIYRDDLELFFNKVAKNVREQEKQAKENNKQNDIDNN